MKALHQMWFGRCLSVWAGFSASSLFATAASGALHLHYAGTGESNSAPLVLRGADARQQLLVSAVADRQPVRDFTHQVRWSAAPAGIVRLDTNGVVRPVADGQAVVTATTAAGVSVSLPVTVRDAGLSEPVNYANQIVPVFTKYGCNGGGCHGKSGGQNGFRLSLLGFEPTEDYEWLVREARGRRLFPAAPERSLLLLKGTGMLPHGGGARIEPGSADYELLVRWISQGLPWGRPEDPSVASVEVWPRERIVTTNSEQQLVVLARYTDGAVKDVTASALYEANEKELARPDADGRVRFSSQPGAVAIMVRYQGKVAVFRATIPLGAPVDQLPSPRNFIDEQVFAQLKVAGMPPSAAADDSVFLRRVTLDLAGRLPTLEETREFLADRRADKRDRLIDTLLDSGDYADLFANKWSALLRNKRGEPSHTRGTFAFHGWIRDALRENKPYDELVREVVAASGNITDHPPVAWFRQVRTMQNQLEDTAQLFLGMRLQCAQCHHHPYERWSEQDYYSFGAFFSQVGRKAGGAPGEEAVFHKRGVAQAVNKKTGQPVKPAGLGATPVSIRPEEDPRQSLADWMTSPDNPFLARALVNRYWKHFFGRGLIEPEDDLRDTNPASNPALVDALTKDFIASRFDLKQLCRNICRSRVYQLSAVPNSYNAGDRQFYSRYYPKRLPAETLLDAVGTLTQSPARFDGLPAGTRAVQLPDNSFNASSYFLTVFGRPESSSACECERSQEASLAQCLHLINAKDMQDRLSADQSRPARIATDPRSDAEKLREIYLVAFSREPSADEVKTVEAHLAKNLAAAKDDKAKLAARRQAYEDVVWALLNTKEFLFNH